jgi:hypothetical protein
LVRLLIVMTVVCWLAVGALDSASAKPPRRVVGVSWGPGHFTGQRALKSWLSKRGVRYQDWVRQHPAGYYLMTHATVKPKKKAPRKVPHHARVPPAPKPAPVARVAVGTTHTSTSLVALIYVVAAIVITAAALPATILTRAVGDKRVVALRTGLGVAGLGVALGATVALLLA